MDEGDRKGPIYKIRWGPVNNQLQVVNFNEPLKNLYVLLSLISSHFFFKYSGPKYSHDTEAKRKQNLPKLSKKPVKTCNLSKRHKSVV